MWRKASASNPSGNCLEADGPWVKAVRSAVNNCLEAQWAASCSAHGSCLEAQFISAAACTSANCLEAAFTSAADCTGGECVEAACESGACVEAAEVNGVVRLRDSKQWKAGNEGPLLAYKAEAWDGGRVVIFIEVDRSEVPYEILDLREDGDPEAQWYVVPGWTAAGDPSQLYFDQAEADAWRDGISKNEFALEVTAA
jgi:hypothetical protein